MRQQTIQAIEQEKIIAIVRGADPQQCLKIAAALYEGGIRLMEITYNQKDPASFQTTADTIAAIAGAIAGVYYGVPEELRQKTLGYMDDGMKEILFAFEERFGCR